MHCFLRGWRHHQANVTLPFIKLAPKIIRCNHVTRAKIIQDQKTKDILFSTSESIQIYSRIERNISDVFHDILIHIFLDRCVWKYL